MGLRVAVLCLTALGIGKWAGVKRPLIYRSHCWAVRLRSFPVLAIRVSLYSSRGDFFPGLLTRTFLPPSLDDPLTSIMYRWRMAKNRDATVCCRQCAGEGVEECRFCAGTGLFKVGRRSNRRLPPWLKQRFAAQRRSKCGRTPPSHAVSYTHLTLPTICSV